jgi:hypothetical protein
LQKQKNMHSWWPKLVIHNQYIRTDGKVLGKQALGMFLVSTDQMEAGKYILNMIRK